MRKVLLDHPIGRVVAFPVETRAGERTFLRLELPDWVNVVAVDEDGRIVIILQYRWGIDANTFEVPGGVIDPGETPEAAARRELREETGFEAKDWQSLGSAYPNPALQDNVVHFFLARGARRVGEPSFDEGEDIIVELWSPQTVRDRLSGGLIRHALVALALERALATL